MNTRVAPASHSRRACFTRHVSEDPHGGFRERRTHGARRTGRNAARSRSPPARSVGGGLVLGGPQVRQVVGQRLAHAPARRGHRQLGVQLHASPDRRGRGRNLPGWRGIRVAGVHESAHAPADVQALRSRRRRIPGRRRQLREIRVRFIPLLATRRSPPRTNGPPPQTARAPRPRPAASGEEQYQSPRSSGGATRARTRLPPRYLKRAPPQDGAPRYMHGRDKNTRATAAIDPAAAATRRANGEADTDRFAARLHGFLLWLPLCGHPIQARIRRPSAAARRTRTGENDVFTEAEEISAHHAAGQRVDGVTRRTPPRGTHAARPRKHCGERAAGQRRERSTRGRRRASRERIAAEVARPSRQIRERRVVVVADGAARRFPQRNGAATESGFARAPRCARTAAIAVGTSCPRQQAPARRPPRRQPPPKRKPREDPIPLLLLRFLGFASFDPGLPPLAEDSCVRRARMRQRRAVMPTSRLAASACIERRPRDCEPPADTFRAADRTRAAARQDATTRQFGRLSIERQSRSDNAHAPSAAAEDRRGGKERPERRERRGPRPRD